jgi:hypothetical protein
MQRYDEAWKVLEKLHRSKSDPEAHLARAEMNQIKAQIEIERVSHSLPFQYVFIKLTGSSRHCQKACGMS